MKDSIGDRMKKNYENRYRVELTRRTPVILRLDGKAFHTVTRNSDKPFDEYFHYSMTTTALYLCNEIMGAKLAYVQSDEISILMTDYDRLATEAWFDYNLQKIVSVSASIAGVIFTRTFFREDSMEYAAFFDARAFNLPRDEVANYFVWRQKDWIRNSVSMLAQANFSHKELQNKKQADMHEMLFSKNINWNDLDTCWKNGLFLIKSNLGSFDINTDYVVTKDRSIIENFLVPKDE